MKTFVIGSLALALAASPVPAQDGGAGLSQRQPAAAPAQLGQVVAVEASGPAPAPAAPTIVLQLRHGHVTPQRTGFNHTGGGNIDVAQPAPEVLIITMAGAAVAGPHPCTHSIASQDFDLEQSFEISADPPKGKQLKLTMEARVIGLLRSHGCLGLGHGIASESGACATISSGPVAVAAVCAPEHSVSGGESLAINDHAERVSVPIIPGRYALHQQFHVMATHRLGLCGKAASAEFAPDPAVDPLWISYWEPFHGANKKDFGFQVVIRLTVE
jgi:hypothetical protein